MVILRALKQEDLIQALRLSRAEGWNQTLEDWAFLAGNKVNVCLAALAGDHLLGTATAMVYDHKVAWIGMVLVDKEHRGRGMGKQLFGTLLDKLHPCLSPKLDATPAGHAVYSKYGFKDEYRIYRMTCPSAPGQSVLPADEKDLEQIRPKNLTEIVAYDSQVFGANRKPLLHYLLKNDPEKAWLIRQGTEVSALVLGRKGNSYHQIGPLQASGTEEAKILIVKALKGIEGKPVAVDVPEDKKELTEWLKTLGFKAQRHFIRMYRKENPFPGIPGKHYLITGPEFG